LGGDDGSGGIRYNLSMKRISLKRKRRRKILSVLILALAFPAKTLLSSFCENFSQQNY